MVETEEEAPVVTVGERLRAAREEKGLSLDEVATQTRIPLRHLQSLEASDWSKLPAPTYTIGFAKSYASAIGLDRSEIGEQLRAEMGGTRPVAGTTEVFEPADPKRTMPKWLVLGAVAAVIVAALVLSWLSRRSLEAPDEAPPAAAGSPAPTAAGAPPAQAAAPQGPVVLTANEPVWIQVSERGGATLFMGELAAGQAYTVPQTATAPVLKTGKPEALRIAVGTADAPAIGPAATTVSNVSLLPGDLMRGGQATAARNSLQPQPQPLANASGQ